MYTKKMAYILTLSCPGCTFINNADNQYCNLCGTSMIPTKEATNTKATTSGAASSEAASLEATTSEAASSEAASLEAASLEAASLETPFSKLNENIIKQQMNGAMIPKTAFRINSPHVNATINDHDVLVLIDTGAEFNVITQQVADKCGLTDQIDTRYNSQVHGVGTCNSIGVLHYVEVRIGDYIIPCKFKVIESEKKSSFSVIIGIETMTMHGAVIDLNKQALILDGTSFSFIPPFA